VDYGEILAQLASLSNPDAVAGMARYGINTKNSYGVSIPVLRAMGRQIGKDHRLAGELWASGVREARILAAYIDDPRRVTDRQMERWARDFDSWDVCDQICSNLFDKTRSAFSKALEWSGRSELFVKRAGFVLMASLAVHDKTAEDAVFESFLPIIQRESLDDRKLVKKAVSWALRQIGKRNRRLNRMAIDAAKVLQGLDSKTARWIASEALRELKGDKVGERLRG
jgi:3-methyladenine DNA glycosylase AlkD